MDIVETKRKIDLFMRWKTAEIKKKLPSDCRDWAEYYCEDDAEAIMEMRPDQITKIQSKLEELIHSDGEIDDNDHCPFCIVYECDSCPYGEVHGICCQDFGNEYDLFISLLCYSITKAIGAENIQAKLQELFGKGGGKR